MTRLTSQQKESIGLLSIGTFLEYFDLMLYVHMAVLLNELFFPKTDPFTASLVTAFSFCSTYVFRPIGALIFGWVGDNIGRRASLIITTFLMAASCIVMAILPTYAQIGISASWIITICRMVQGMSSMGERIGAEIYLTEITTPPKQYPIVTLIASASNLGMTVALVVASFVTSYALNWRYAFWFGLSVALVGAVARTRLRETSDFIDFQKKSKKYLDEYCDTEEEKEEALKSPIFQESVSKKTSLSLFFIQCAYPACFYLTYGYCSDVLRTTFNYTAEQIIQNNLIVSVFDLIMVLFILPFLSYYIYPLKIIRVNLTIFSMVILVVPYILSIADSPFYILVLQSILAPLALGVIPAAAIVYRHFPIAKRFTYTAFIYAFARALMYIITSFGLVYLVKNFGYYGVLVVMLPVIIGYMFGLNHFEKLEKECGNYPEGWFNINVERK